MSTNCLSQKVKTEWKELETAYRIQNPLIVHYLIRMAWRSASPFIHDPKHFFITMLLFEMLISRLGVLSNVPSTCKQQMHNFILLRARRIKIAYQHEEKPIK